MQFLNVDLISKEFEGIVCLVNKAWRLLHKCWMCRLQARTGTHKTHLSANRLQMANVEMVVGRNIKLESLVIDWSIENLFVVLE